jgi:hypothetical protein
MMMRSFLAVLMVLAAVTAARADRISYYATGQPPASGSTSVSGTENSAVVAVNSPTKQYAVLMIAVQNYDAANPKMAMLFDAGGLPATGAIPLAACAAPAATGVAAPGQCSFALPSDGRGMAAGIVVACSTSGKTLTLDGTAGGNCYFQVGFR